MEAVSGEVWIYVTNFNSLFGQNPSNGDWDQEKNLIFFLSHDNAKLDPAAAGSLYQAEFYIWASSWARDYSYP